MYRIFMSCSDNGETETRNEKQTNTTLATFMGNRLAIEWRQGGDWTSLIALPRNESRTATKGRHGGVARPKDGVERSRGVATSAALYCAPFFAIIEPTVGRQS